VIWEIPESTGESAYQFLVNDVVQSLIDILFTYELLDYGKGKTMPKLSDSEILIGYK